MNAAAPADEHCFTVGRAIWCQFLDRDGFVNPALG
jgi:hypothetical protein